MNLEELLDYRDDIFELINKELGADAAIDAYLVWKEMYHSADKNPLERHYIDAEALEESVYILELFYYDLHERYK